VEHVRVTDLAGEIDSCLQRLFPITRSITGQGNRETLSLLREIAPIEIKEYPSGTPVYDWVIPPEWRVRDAYIKNRRGQRMVDFQACNVHLVSYSEPVSATMSFAELKPHLHVHPELPEAIPYRTSYYRRDWGFCVTHAQREALEAERDGLQVVIDSELDEAGSLTVGELLIPGESEEEILISTYFCHPSLANDNLSGTVLTAFLARELLAGPRPLHSYRIVWVPETIGAIAYCAMNEATMKRIDSGLVVTTVGGPGTFGYKQSFDREHPINAMIEEVFDEAGVEFVTYPFDIHGSDERQYSSQGFRINVASITKEKYYEYAYYHTSLDNLEFVNGEQIAESLALHRALLGRLDKNLCYRNLKPHCEVMLSKHGLYPASGGALLPGNELSVLDIRLWLLSLCDGETPLPHISRRLGCSMEALYREAEELVSHGVMERRGSPTGRRDG
jgi:aminopeptidase-like protein